MRFLHTADWHLGRILHGRHLTEDQAHLLDQFVEMARDARPDAILLAGDVYDRAVPPPEAVSLLDETLSRLILDLRIPVMIIAGNHDSPERLAFASRVLTREGLHLFGSLDGLPAPVILTDEHGEVEIHAVPYADPPFVRVWLGPEGGAAERDGAPPDHAGAPPDHAGAPPDHAGAPPDHAGAPLDHDGAMRSILARLRRQASPPGRRAVLMTHAFVAGGQAGDSERPLSVGGAGTVSAGAFEGWDYVALGHLHRAQTAGGGTRLRYSGSLFPYSFDEAGQVKVVSLVELGAHGALSVEEIGLRPRREVRKLTGFLADLLRPAGRDAGSRDDYMMVTLLDPGPAYDAIGRLRQIYPNILDLRPAWLSGVGEMTAGAAAAGSVGDAGRARGGPTGEERFRLFYLDVTGSELTPEESEMLTSTLAEIDRREREVSG